MRYAPREDDGQKILLPAHLESPAARGVRRPLQWQRTESTPVFLQTQHTPADERRKRGTGEKRKGDPEAELSAVGSLRVRRAPRSTIAEGSAFEGEDGGSDPVS